MKKEDLQRIADMPPLPRQILMTLEENTPKFGWDLHGDAIAVKRNEEEKMTKGGIIIPDTAQEKAHTGILIAIGDEITHFPDDHPEWPGMKRPFQKFRVGQQIKFGKYAGSEMTGDDGEEYILMRKFDILAFKK